MILNVDSQYAILCRFIRLKLGASLNLHSSLLHAVDQCPLNHTLVAQEDIRVKDVHDILRVVDFTTESRKWLGIISFAPDANVVHLGTDSNEIIGQAEHPQGLNGLWLQAVSTPSAGLVGPVINNL
jgi:hypothetical protein